MKFRTFLFLSLLGSANLFATTHHPSISLNYDFTKKTFDPHVEHNIVIPFENDHYFVVFGHVKPKSFKSHHSDGGVAYRKFFDKDWGFGLNFSHMASNIFGFHAHQFAPGIEVFMPYVQVSMNKYWPLKSKVEIKDKIFKFNDASEIIFSVKPHEIIGLDLGTYYNHQTLKFGYHGSILANVYDNIIVGIHPYFEPNVSKGVSFSIGYSFGPNRQGGQSINKSHRFFYSFAQKPKEKPLSLSTITPKNPVGPTKAIAPPETKKESTSDVKTDTKKPRVIDRLFFWNTTSR